MRYSAECTTAPTGSWGVELTAAGKPDNSRLDTCNVLVTEAHVGDAVAGFVAYWYNKVNVDRLLLVKSLAILQIFVAITNLLTKIGTVDKVWQSICMTCGNQFVSVLNQQ